MFDVLFSLPYRLATAGLSELQTVAESLGPAEALELLLPYAEQHKNPKVRGRAAGPAAVALASMQVSCASLPWTLVICLPLWDICILTRFQV